MNYWGTDAANLSECFEPLVALVEKLVDNGQKPPAIIMIAPAAVLTTTRICGAALSPRQIPQARKIARLIRFGR